MLVYAPGTKSGESQMASILQSLNLSHHILGSPNEERKQNKFDANGWVLLLPMKSSASDLTSSSLGDKLEDALERNVN